MKTYVAIRVREDRYLKLYWTELLLCLAVASVWAFFTTTTLSAFLWFLGATAVVWAATTVCLWTILSSHCDRVDYLSECIEAGEIDPEDLDDWDEITDKADEIRAKFFSP